MHTKREAHKCKFLQHALFRYVYNRSLFAIFTIVATSNDVQKEKKKAALW
mgnify:CR=1 FL=1